MINLQTVAPWFSGLVALLALAISLAGARNKALTDKLARHSTRIDDLETRATKIEQTLTHLPNKDATHDLKVSIEQLRADIRVIAARVEPIASIADRLQEFLLEKAK